MIYNYWDFLKMTNPEGYEIFHYFHFLFCIGLTIGVTVIEGTFDKMYGESQAARLSLRQGIQEEGVKGFPDVVVSRFHEALQS